MCERAVLRGMAGAAAKRRNALAVRAALHRRIVHALQVALQRRVRNVAVDASRVQQHALDLREGLQACVPIRRGRDLRRLELAAWPGRRGEHRNRHGAYRNERAQRLNMRDHAEGPPFVKTKLLSSLTGLAPSDGPSRISCEQFLSA